MPFCRNCGAEYSEGTEFCSECCAALESPTVNYSAARQFSLSDAALGLTAIAFSSASEGLAGLMCKALHRCRYCEAKLLPEARFCIDCGTPV